MKLVVLSEVLSQIQWYKFLTFSQKWNKYQTWVLEHREHHIMMDYVQNTGEPKLSPQINFL